MKRGKDVRLAPFVVIKRPELVELGSHVAIDPFFYMTTGAKIGNWVHISSNVSVIGGETGCLLMDDYTAIATGCRLICVSDDFANGEGIAVPFIPNKFKSHMVGQSISMGKHSVLGANTVVLPGVTIGEGAVVGANSVVTKNLDPWGVYVGSPAYKIRNRPKKGLVKKEKEIEHYVLGA
jgi:galactoside O-acetyltransferase